MALGPNPPEIEASSLALYSAPAAQVISELRNGDPASTAAMFHQAAISPVIDAAALGGAADIMLLRAWCSVGLLEILVDIITDSTIAPHAVNPYARILQCG